MLYDASLPEIRAIVPMPDGTVYAAALGGSVAKRAQAAAQAAQGAARRRGRGQRPPPPSPWKRRTPARRRNQAARASQAAAAAGRSASPRRRSARSSRRWWTSAAWKNPRSIASIPTTRWRRCGVPRRKTSTICWRSKSRFCSPPTRTAASTACRPTAASPWCRRPTKAKPRACCLPTIPCWPPPATWAASSAWAKRPAPAGSYEAPVHDSGTASRWGSLSWRADVPRRLRAGVPHPLRQFRQARPHLERLVARRCADAAGSRIASPNARYIQWKAEMAGEPAAPPRCWTASPWPTCRRIRRP